MSSSGTGGDDRIARVGRRSRGDVGDFAHGQFQVDWEDRPAIEELRQARVARAQALLRDSDLDALLVFKDENVRYLTGMRAQLISGKTALLNGCLLRREGPPIMLISGGDLQRARNAMTWIEEFHPIPILEATGLIEGAVEGTLAPLLRRYGSTPRASGSTNARTSSSSRSGARCRASSSTTATR